MMTKLDMSQSMYLSDIDGVHFIENLTEAKKIKNNNK